MRHVEDKFLFESFFFAMKDFFPHELPQTDDCSEPSHALPEDVTHPKKTMSE